MRGEYANANAVAHRDAGPSPRAWGIPTQANYAPARERSIPTCVGNTMTEEVNESLEEVHPHVRGEY